MKFKHRHITVLAGLSLVLPAAAEIIYSDLRNIPVPNDYDGLYLDVDTGNFNMDMFNPVSGWDINPFFGGLVLANSPDFQPVRTVDSSLGTLANFAAGDVIGGGSLYTTEYGGTGYGGSQTHLGTTFAAGTVGTIGFKLGKTGGGWNYGWMRVVFNGVGTDALIKDWAYDNTGAAITVGRVRQEAPVEGVQLVTLSPKSGEDFTLGSLITNTGGNVNHVVKTEAGSVTLTGNNSYTGTTTVSEGRLLVNGTLSGPGMVSVAHGAILGGTGSISGPVNVSGVLSPGASVATLATGELTLNNLSTFAYEMDSSVTPSAGSPSADLQLVSGNLNLNGSVNLTMSDLAADPLAYPVNTRFSLINYTGSWNGGVFTYDLVALTNGAVFNAGLNTWQISYNASSGGTNFSGEYVTGNFVNLTVVPETGAALLGGLGLLTLLRRRRIVSPSS